MALFSDVDWVIIAVVAAFLFMGPQGQPFIRQMGRWYGRFLQLKSELMSEVAASMGTDGSTSASTSSLRASLLGPEPSPEPTTPLTLPPPQPGLITHVQPFGLWAVGTQSLGAGMGPETWWITSTNSPGEVVRLR